MIDCTVEVFLFLFLLQNNLPSFQQNLCCTMSAWGSLWNKSAATTQFQLKWQCVLWIYRWSQVKVEQWVPQCWGRAVSISLQRRPGRISLAMIGQRCWSEVAASINWPHLSSPTSAAASNRLSVSESLLQCAHFIWKLTQSNGESRTTKSIDSTSQWTVPKQITEASAVKKCTWFEQQVLPAFSDKVNLIGHNWIYSKHRSTSI